jgi:hypothetical protein
MNGFGFSFLILFLFGFSVQAKDKDKNNKNNKIAERKSDDNLTSSLAATRKQQIRKVSYDLEFFF